MGPVLAPILALDEETADQWMDRFILSRTGKVTTVDRDHRLWLKHISPILGKRPITRVTPDDIEAVRDYLDGEIDRWEASGKLRGKVSPSTPQRTCGRS